MKPVHCVGLLRQLVSDWLNIDLQLALTYTPVAAVTVDASISANSSNATEYTLQSLSRSVGKSCDKRFGKYVTTCTCNHTLYGLWVSAVLAVAE